jgi:hypothetical protein
VTISHFFRSALGASLFIATGLAPSLAAAASAKTAINYGVTLAGFPIGTANLAINLSDGGPYKIDASAKVGGLIRLISDGRGSASSSGKLGSSQVRPTAYTLTSVAGKKPQSVQMALAGGNVTALQLQPDLPPRKDRVPLTDANKHGVIDPLSAVLVPVTGSATLDASACRRLLPVFDGAQRFDIRLSYARTEQVSGKGYAGPAIVCSARYVPIAGHRPSRSQTKFMVDNRDIELWLAPIGETHVLAPFKIIIGTQIGRLTLTASRFGGDAE